MLGPIFDQVEGTTCLEDGDLPGTEAMGEGDGHPLGFVPQEDLSGQIIHLNHDLIPPVDPPVVIGAGE